MTRGRRRGVRRPPLPVVLVAIVGAGALFVLPLASLLVRAPWASLPDLVTAPSALTALRLSLVCSLSATAASITFGVPLAWLLARHEFPGKSMLRGLVLLPIALPPIVGGVVLLLALGRRGLAGQYLDQWFGVRLPFTTAGAIVAATFVAMPFLVIAVEGALRQVDSRLEEAAVTLGASQWTVWRRITLPSIMPTLVAGAAFCWARALGEFGATISFAGSFPGETRTLPLEVFLALETDRDAAVALSLVLVAISVAVLVITGRYSVFGSARARDSRDSRDSYGDLVGGGKAATPGAPARSER
ncbi:MAG: ABC transporter permease [Acidimicrobiia bacterium]|nr:ABC transporter permease [Acidimicrobiia bacterium]